MTRARENHSDRDRFSAAVLCTALMLFLLAPAAFAEIETERIGFSPNHLFDGAIKGENVDVMSGNLTIGVPLGPRFALGDWFGYQLKLYYNSTIWEHSCDSLTVEGCPDGKLISSDPYGQGFLLHFGRLYQHPLDKTSAWRYQTPDGADHFVCMNSEDCPGLSLTTLDMSSLTILTGGDYVAYPGDGTKITLGHYVGDIFPGDEGFQVPELAQAGGWYATRVETVATDGNGQPQHYFDIEYVGQNTPGVASDNRPVITRITDSAVPARQIVFTESVDGLSTRIAFPAFGQDPAVYTLQYSNTRIYDPITEAYDFDPGEDPPRFFIVRRRLESILLPVPEFQASEDYEFGYNESEADDGNAGLESFGYLTRWKLPTGAEMQYHYSHYRTSDRKPYRSEMRSKTLLANGKSYTWKYKRFGESVTITPGGGDPMDQGTSFSGTNPHTVNVVDPFNNLTIYEFNYRLFNPIDPNDCDYFGCTTYWNDGLLKSVYTYAGPVPDGSRLVRQESYTYMFDGDSYQYRNNSTVGGASTVYGNVRQERVEVFTPGAGSYPPRTTRTESKDWTTGLIKKAKKVEEHDDFCLYRRTVTNHTPNLEFQSLYKSRRVENAVGTVLSRTDVEFENGRLVCQVMRADPTNGADVTDPCDPTNVLTGDVVLEKDYHPDSGNLVSTTTAGGDGTTSYEATYEFSGGALKKKQFVGLTSWFAVDRDIDADSGLVVTDRGPDLVETNYSWDKLGRLTQVSPHAPEKAVVVQYVNIGETRVSQTISPTNFTEAVYYYDELGQLVEEKRRNRDGGYDVRRTKYDISGRTTRQSAWAADGTADEEMAWTEFSYELFPNPNAGEPGEPDYYTDPLGRVSKITRPDGGTTTTEYKALATTVTVSGVQGATGLVDSVTTYVNDSFGRLIEVKSPAGGADAAYSYDELDNLVRVDLIDAGASPEFVQTRSFVYDRLGRLRAAANPESGTTEYLAYDARGKLLEHRDANQNHFKSSYDAAGRLLSTALRVNANWLLLVENTYDGPAAGASFGKLLEQKSYRIKGGQSVLVSRRKNVFGSATQSSSCTSTLNFGEVAFASLNGRLKRTELWLQPWNEKLQTEYCYNEMGLPYLVKYPHLAGSGRTRAEVGQLYSNGVIRDVHDLGRNASYVADIRYDPSGAVTQIIRGNGVATLIDRDAQGRPLSFLMSVEGSAGPRPPLESVFGCNGGGEEIVEFQQCSGPPEPTPIPLPAGGWTAFSGPYQYDLAGNVKRIGENSYGYDALHRLVSAAILDRDLNEHVMAYEYDAFGNMLKRTKSGVVTDYAVSADTNRLASHNPGSAGPYTHLYDANGNMTSNGGTSYSYNERNQLVEVWDVSNEAVARYDYDASGFRVRWEIEGVETYYARDDAGGVLSEFRRAVGETGPAGWDKDYIYAAGQAVTVVKNDLPATMSRPWTLDVSNPIGNGIRVRWTPSDEPDLFQYRLVRTIQTSAAPDTTKEYFPKKTWTSRVDSFSQGELDPNDPTTVIEYTMEAIDTAFNYGDPSAAFRIQPFAAYTPPAPQGVTVAPTDGAVRLTWSPVVAVGPGTGVDVLWGYYVEQEHVESSVIRVNDLPITETTFLDVGLVNGAEYRYCVRAVDTSGNQSPACVAPVPATPEDNVPPGRPLGVVAQPGLLAGEVRLFWLPAVEDDVASYEVRRVGPGPTETVTAVAAGVPFVDTGLSSEVVYTYTVTAFDEIPNPSPPSNPATVRPRNSSNVPQNVTAAFHVEVIGTLNGSDLNNCGNIFQESDDLLGVKIEWDPMVGLWYRIYRARDDESLYTKIAEVGGCPGGCSSYLDTQVGTGSYRYHVVTWDGTRESAASGEVPVTAAFNPASFVRNLKVTDGADYFTTWNRRARRMYVNWSDVLDPGLLGYHVYRRCAWEGCLVLTHAGADLPSCEPIWVRVTQQPVTATNVFTDTTVGGLSGCFLYTVRPVGLDGTEGPVNKITGIEAFPDGSALPSQTSCWKSDVRLPYPPAAVPLESSWRTHDDERARINNIARGNDPPGALAAPHGIAVQLLTHQQYVGSATIYAYITWTPNKERDLRGYFVEMAGSPNGPWQRLNGNPVAWWEAEYTARGIGLPTYVDPEVPYWSGDPLCAHFRVIAVDEEKHESEPGFPAAWPYPFSNCGSDPTPPAPTNLVASTEDGGSGPGPLCSTRLQWDAVVPEGMLPEELEYRVYRYRPDFNVNVFYQTHSQTAADCVDGVCTFVETGNDSSYFSDPELNCPWGNGAACILGNLGAYYIRAKGPTGGESPRSNLVFWDCRWSTADTPYASLTPIIDQDLDELVLLADAGNAPALGVFDDPRLEDAPVETDPVCALYGTGALGLYANNSGSSAAIAPLLTLGEVTADPPIKFIDLHVDHLGSTRLTTGDAGNVISEHEFLPFGEEIPELQPKDDSTKMFTGHERDRETGLDYMLARYYGSSLARFLSVDPVNGRPRNPQSWNRYAYVGNNPLAFIDPNGEDRYAILVGDPGLGEHNVGRNFERVAETRQASLEAAGHTADITRVSTVGDVNTAITSGDTIDGGVILISHGGALVSPSGETPAVFIGEGAGADTNLTAANAGELSNANLGPDATVELAACNSAGVAQPVADALGRSTTGTEGSMSFSPDPDAPMSSDPGTTPPATGPLHLVPDEGSQRVTREPS